MIVVGGEVQQHSKHRFCLFRLIDGRCQLFCSEGSSACPAQSCKNFLLEVENHPGSLLPCLDPRLVVSVNGNKRSVETYRPLVEGDQGSDAAGIYPVDGYGE